MRTEDQNIIHIVISIAYVVKALLAVKWDAV